MVGCMLDFVGYWWHHVEFGRHSPAHAMSAPCRHQGQPPSRRSSGCTRPIPVHPYRSPVKGINGDAKVLTVRPSSSQDQARGQYPPERSAPGHVKSSTYV